jgi:radical SAM superfamily enzyme YgiQ (UPF0313 family)
VDFETGRDHRFRLRPEERLAREQGTVIKDWGGRLPIALVYPNSYYIGMSNLGIHALYRFLNNDESVVAERVFWEPIRQAQGRPIRQAQGRPIRQAQGRPDTRDKRLGPLSVESQRPLPDFAVLAFSISYELDYFNIAPILKSGGIPAFSAERDERHPLIIAGGPCVTANPMPLSPFFDCLCIGEAESILPKLLPALSGGIGGPRDDLLKSLARIPGVYVPRYPAPVQRQWTKNLDEFPVTSAVLTPDTELGDMYLMEVERGCKWRCRFCLVGTAFSPMRYRSLGKLLEMAKEGLKYRKRLGLVGPAVSDHPQLDELLVSLREMGAQFAVSSLRVSSLSDKALEEIARGGAETITIAPEAGSQRLREAIRKGICEEDILGAMGKIADLNVKQVKLYFMIGLPSETDDDIEEIINLTLKCKEMFERKRSGTRLTLNIAPFVPKAGTSFQRFPAAPVKTLDDRMARLKDRLMPQGIRLKMESPPWSEIQAVLSRGDAKIAGVLADVEKPSLSAWRRAVAKYDLDVDFYAHQEWGEDERVAWGGLSS